MSKTKANKSGRKNHAYFSRVTPLWDIYDDVSQSMEQHKPKLIKLMEMHIRFEQLIPPEFRWAYYSRMGRKHIYHLENILRAAKTLLNSGTNLDARCQYINRHFCYAAKFGILTNGLGICRHIECFDETFRKHHPEIGNDTSTNPDTDKEPGDSTSLGPVLAYFFRPHPKVCPESKKDGNTRICTCEHPCTASSYGKYVYTYPDSEFRLCPGIPRNTQQWDELYSHRVTVERTIHLFKDTFVLDTRKSHRTISAKADIYLAGITQLIGVLLADALHNLKYSRSIRKLLAA